MCAFFFKAILCVDRDGMTGRQLAQVLGPGQAEVNNVSPAALALDVKVIFIPPCVLCMLIPGKIYRAA